MVSEAVSFCTVVAFSLVITNCWCRPTEEPKSFIRVAAKSPLTGNLFADREGHIYLSAIPKVVYQNPKEQQQKQQQQQQSNQHYSEFTIGDGFKEQKNNDLNNGRKIIIVYKNESPKKSTQQKESTLNEKQIQIAGGESEAEHLKENVEYYGYPQYRFRYEVDDPKTKDKKFHFEERDGDKVTGKYSILEPDGHVRTVDYKADDKTGFNAIVSRDGNEIEF